MENKINSGKLDVDGVDLFVGDKIQQTNYNGETYIAVYEIAFDEELKEPCLKMISGNKKAMSLIGNRAFGAERNGRLVKGRLINRPI